MKEREKNGEIKWKGDKKRREEERRREKKGKKEGEYNIRKENIYLKKTDKNIFLKLMLDKKKTAFKSGKITSRSNI